MQSSRPSFNTLLSVNVSFIFYNSLSLVSAVKYFSLISPCSNTSWSPSDRLSFVLTISATYYFIISVSISLCNFLPLLIASELQSKIPYSYVVISLNDPKIPSALVTTSLISVINGSTISIKFLYDFNVFDFR